jgi:hypothetical protein
LYPVIPKSRRHPRGAAPCCPRGSRPAGSKPLLHYLSKSDRRSRRTAPPPRPIALVSAVVSLSPLRPTALLSCRPIIAPLSPHAPCCHCPAAAEPPPAPKHPMQGLLGSPRGLLGSPHHHVTPMSLTVSASVCHYLPVSASIGTTPPHMGTKPPFSAAISTIAKNSFTTISPTVSPAIVSSASPDDSAPSRPRP